MKKELWFDGSKLIKEEWDILTDAVNRGYTTVVLPNEGVGKIILPSKVKNALYIEDITDVERYPNIDIFIVKNSELAAELTILEKKVAVYVNVENRESMELAANIKLNIQYLIVEFKDTTNIPLELILAKSQYVDIKVLKIVSDVSDAMIAMGVMETGSDGVILRSQSIDEISSLSLEIQRKQMEKINLVPCEIIETRHLEMGARACLDTTNLLTEKEGMIVGCTSSGGLMICSEVHYLPYMNTRPFRVNAGTISSYVWGPNNMVEYISDLCSGSNVVVDLEGNARTVNIARVKTENRPLMLIRAKYKETEIKCIMQDDWHMRVFSPEGKVVNITDLKKGDLVMGHVCDSGRHVGIKISENIYEC